jgi:hypothetical protein
VKGASPALSGRKRSADQTWSIDTWVTGRSPCSPRIGHRLSRLMFGPVPLGIGDPEDLRTGQPLLVGGQEVAQRGGVVGEDHRGRRLLGPLDSADARRQRFHQLQARGV